MLTSEQSFHTSLNEDTADITRMAYNYGRYHQHSVVDSYHRHGIYGRYHRHGIVIRYNRHGIYGRYVYDRYCGMMEAMLSLIPNLFTELKMNHEGSSVAI